MHNGKYFPYVSLKAVLNKNEHIRHPGIMCYASYPEENDMPNLV